VPLGYFGKCQNQNQINFSFVTGVWPLAVQGGCHPWAGLVLPVSELVSGGGCGEGDDQEAAGCPRVVREADDVPLLFVLGDCGLWGGGRGGHAGAR